MGSRYIHLLSTDVDDAILKLNGIVKEESHHAEFKAVICPRCKKSNSPRTRLCLTCGSALDIKHALELDRKDDVREKIEEVSTELAKPPEIFDMLLNAIQLLKNDNRVANS